MIFRKQLIRHDPENGKYGDCHRTALACLLNREPETVPHLFDSAAVVDGGAGFERFNEWLIKEGGVLMVTVAFDLDPSGLLRWAEAMNPGVYWLMGCQSRIANHTVVCCGGEVVCDPSWTPTPVDELRRSTDGYVWYTVLVPRSQVRLGGEREKHG